MTQEEARLTLQENFGLLSFEHPGRISEAIKIAIEVLSQPSLPSNLDEAAKQFQGRWDNDQSPEASFKAGAEWMAGQGETIEGEVEKDIKNNLVVLARGLSGKNAVFGDKVIAQIRKK